MPANTTHMYVAGRLALDFPSNHKSDVIQDINKGFNEWLQANKTFRKGAQDAISKNDGKQMQKVMDAYRAGLNSDAITVFSAFTAGSQGPDLWVLPHSIGDMLSKKDDMRITGTVQFDLGHYNLSHAFPRAVLERIKMQEKSLPALQRKYQTAYILGYLSHIALDITAHIKVNVFAGAYYQLEKIWENEFGIMPGDTFLSRNVWSNHNKIEHYVDTIVRLVCFEGCHSSMASFDTIRKNDLEQAEGWDFPNYRDYWHNLLKFGKVIKTNGIWDKDEKFLDNSTSLPGPFASRYGASNPAQRVIPFIYADFLRAYGLCDDAIMRHRKSIVNLPSEHPKLAFYRLENHSDITSQYYLRRWVYPDISRVNDFANKFFDMSAFAKFILIGKKTGREFIDGALKYLESGDSAIFEQLRNWNLDLGLAIRIKDISTEKDSAYPKKPPRPVAIELVNVIDEVKALASWKPPACNAKRYGNSQEAWSVPKKTEPNPKPGILLSGKSGGDAAGVFYAQSGIDVRLSGFKLYVDTDEMAVYLWGEKADLNAIIKIPKAKKGYKISRCVEDFVVTDSFTAVKDRTAGQASVKEYQSMFLGNIPPDPSATPVATGAKSIGEYGLRPLPRNLRISLCRKYVFKPTNSGRFSPDRFTIYNNPSPTEEVCLSVFVFVKNTKNYTDLFSHMIFTQAQVEQLKHIKSIGVNVILLLMGREKDASTKRMRLKLLEAFVDGELQPVKPPGNTPPAAVWRVEFEDAHFRTDSAVLMPNSLTYKKKTGETASPDLNEVEGLAILQVIHVQTKEQPKQKVLIAGHTDRVGRDEHNISLSADRASSIMFLLEGKKDEWRYLADRRKHDDDITQALAWVSTEYGWDCHPVKTEGASYMQKVTATKKFQKKYNEEFIDKGRVDKAYSVTNAKRIGEDGDCGPDTWGAIFDVYQDTLAKKLATTFENMKTFHTQFSGRWVEDANKAVPCGETFPREQPEEDNFESPINRRVEVLFFDPPEMPKLPLPCASSDVAVTQTKTTTLSSSAAKTRLQNCTDNCPVYIGKKTPIPIPVTPHKRPQTAPSFTMPESPTSTTEQPIDNLIVYLSYYDTTGNAPVQVRKLRAKKGKLHEYGTDKEATVDGDRDTFVYVSHREDLDTSDRATRFSKDKSGLPLVGPAKFPCGDNVSVSLKIWDQNDWIVVKCYPVDGKAPDTVFLADWKTNYTIGYYGKTKDTGEDGFWSYGDPNFKSSQETWNNTPPPVELPFITAANGEKRWVGTLSLHTTPEAKILLAVKRPSGYLYANSINEIKFEKKNIERNSFHTYNKTLVAQLMALKQDEDRASAIDALPQPPATYYLPGDMCWHSQGQTNNCGAYSFAASMNYWYPSTNNFDTKNGAWYADTSRVPSIINGARTPSNISEAAERFAMYTRENSADDLDKDRALKLLKLWLSAGIPVMILVEEDYGVMSLHWKVVTGYEGNRIFYVNSGGDHELLLKNRTAGINYDTAAVGNDVDAIDDGYKKWKVAGSLVVGGIVATSIDPCILMPIYPKDQLFAGDAAQ